MRSFCLFFSTARPRALPKEWISLALALDVNGELEGTYWWWLMAFWNWSLARPSTAPEWWWWCVPLPSFTFSIWKVWGRWIVGDQHKEANIRIKCVSSETRIRIVDTDRTDESTAMHLLVNRKQIHRLINSISSWFTRSRMLRLFLSPARSNTWTSSVFSFWFHLTKKKTIRFRNDAVVALCVTLNSRLSSIFVVVIHFNWTKLETYTFRIDIELCVREKFVAHTFEYRCQATPSQAPSVVVVVVCGCMENGNIQAAKIWKTNLRLSREFVLWNANIISNVSTWYTYGTVVRIMCSIRIIRKRFTLKLSVFHILSSISEATETKTIWINNEESLVLLTSDRYGERSIIINKNKCPTNSVVFLDFYFFGKTIFAFNHLDCPCFWNTRTNWNVGHERERDNIQNFDLSIWPGSVCTVYMPFYRINWELGVAANTQGCPRL